jgi:hypothetical protein
LLIAHPGHGPEIFECSEAIAFCPIEGDGHEAGSRVQLARVLLSKGLPEPAARMLAHEALLNEEAAWLLVEALAAAGDEPGAKKARERAEQMSEMNRARRALEAKQQAAPAKAPPPAQR